MKIAISIPDELKLAADRRANEAGTSRSAVFAEALQYYLLHTDKDRVTQALNAVYESGEDDAASEGPDLFLLAASRHVLDESEW